MKKIVASLFVICFVLTMVGTADMCAAANAPELQSPVNGTLFTTNAPITFNWAAGVPPNGDTVSSYCLVVKYYLFGGVEAWGYISNTDSSDSSNGLHDTTYTWLPNNLHQFVYLHHQDIIEWKVGVYYYWAGGPYYSEIGAFNVLKTPASWIDNSSWETYTCNASRVW